MTEFPYEIELNVRYRDLDPQGHVNNAVCATYLEHARTGYFQDVLDATPEDPGEIGIVVANLELNYRRPIEFQSTVTVGLRTTALGKSSIKSEYEIRADGEVAVTAASTMVAVDETGSPETVPEDVREQIADYENL